jgi:RimJ/RimL family protein N-acetyltransferase
MLVKLRDLRLEDANISYKWRNDPEIWIHTGRNWNNAVSLDVEKNWIKDSIDSKSVKRLAICVGENSTYIGNVQITNIDNKKGIFHIFIGNKNYWGKGIGSIASQLMIEYSKKTLGLSEISLYVLSSNIKAFKIYKKLGFETVNLVGDKIQMTLKLD